MSGAREFLAWADYFEGEYSMVGKYYSCNYNSDNSSSPSDYTEGGYLVALWV